jgi:UDP-N-acetylmuramoyl-L-alanyl-D-glutamate--2,6-diaminopimelate ligase
MMAKSLSELIVNLPDVIHVTGEAAIAAPVAESDAELQPGGLFVARRGLSVDGHDFIPRAIEKGAAAIVGEREIRDLPVPYVQVGNAQEATGYLAAAYHDFPSRKLIVIGVTGTDGKTTTSTLIHSILNKLVIGRAGLISTVAADVGDQSIDTGLHVTTPGAPQIQNLLARMVDNGLRYCVLEMTSHGLAQGRLNGVELDVAVLTNLTHEHLDYHGSFENYRAAKGRLFEMLGHSVYKPKSRIQPIKPILQPADWHQLSLSDKRMFYPKTAVINADDSNASFFASFPVDRLITYGLKQGDYVATDIAYRPDGIAFSVFGIPEWFDKPEPRRLMDLKTPLVGEFNIYNCLAAIETCFALPVGSGFIETGIEKFKGIPGRMERINEGQDFTAIVDFAHTPNALKNALQAGRGMLQPGNKLIAVFGSAGLRDREKRRLMAEVAAELADFTILTAEDPRTESLDGILQVMADAMIAKGGVEGETFIRVPDRGEALYRACQMAKPGDIVMACGKGHEQSMCFGTTEYPWDDRDALREAIKGEAMKGLPTARK